MSVRPTWFLLALLILWAVLGAAIIFAGIPTSMWMLCGAVIAGISLIDVVILNYSPIASVSRELPEVLPIGVERQVVLHIRSTRQQQLEVFDLYPANWPCHGLPKKLTLKPGKQVRLSYFVTPEARGKFEFEGVQLRQASALKLWKQQRQVACAQSVRVYPNFAPLTKLALFSADQALQLIGAHLQRRRGEGTDFHQMREYRTGDSLRQLDWKATARVGKLISREYQDEKNQQLMVMIDSGRRMMASEGGLSHFDHVLNAALLVSYLALKQGDTAGLFATGGETRWVSPQRGLAAIEALLRASFDLQPAPVATDYLAAATQLCTRQRRRSLVMLVTNVRDEDIEDLLVAVRLLRQRHLVCVASLREEVIDQALEQPIHDLPHAIEASAAAHYLQQRDAAHDLLRRNHVSVLDVTCQELPAALAEHYLRVKREGKL